MTVRVDWLTGLKLAERWDTIEQSVIAAVENGLPVYEDIRNELIPKWGVKEEDNTRSIEKISLPDFMARYSCGKIQFEILLFRTDEVEQYEKDTGNAPLSNGDQIALRNLKRESKKLDASIEAAVVLTIEFVKNNGYVKKDLLAISKERFPKQSNANFERIWKAIPSHCKAMNGQHRPPSTLK